MENPHHKIPIQPTQISDLIGHPQDEVPGTRKQSSKNAADLPQAALAEQADLESQ
jgi:hypothetical protein